jgi:hypothetical protein
MSLRILAGALAASFLFMPVVQSATTTGTCSQVLDKPVYLPGDPINLTITGQPGDVVFLFLSPNPDPLTTSTSPPMLLGTMPSDGILVASCTIHCLTPEMYLTSVLVDLAAYDPGTMAGVCITNEEFIDVALDASCGAAAEGCTPGYWKQSQHFDSWPAPYTPSTLFSDVFDDAFPGLTLVEVLALEGGGLSALGRHTVAALLNAATGSVGSGLTEQEIIDLFNFALGQSAADIEALKDVLAELNEIGCPLS